MNDKRQIKGKLDHVVQLNVLLQMWFSGAVSRWFKISLMKHWKHERCINYIIIYSYLPVFPES